MMTRQSFKVAGWWVMLAAMLGGGASGYFFSCMNMDREGRILRNKDPGHAIRAPERKTTSPAVGVGSGLSGVTSFLRWLPEDRLGHGLKKFGDIGTEGIRVGGGEYFEHAVALLTLDDIAKEDPGHIFDSLLERRNLHLRADQVRVVMERWFEQDPHGLALRVEGIPRSEDGDVVRRAYLELLMTRSPAAAFSRLGEDGHCIRQGDYSQLFESWGKMDRGGACAALNSIKDSNKKVEAVTGLSRSWAAGDFQGAWTWVGSQDSASQRQVFMELCSNASKADGNFIFSRLERMEGDDIKGVLLGGGLNLVRLDARKYYERLEAVLSGDALTVAVLNTCTEALPRDSNVVTEVYERTPVGALRDKMAIGIFDAWKDINQDKATEWFRGVDLPEEMKEERVAHQVEGGIRWGE